MSRPYLAALATAGLCYAALGAVLSILPTFVERSLGAGSVAVGLAVGAPSLAAVVARPLGGHLADRAGPRPVVVGGAALMAGATLPLVLAPAGTASGTALLLASRLAAGAGEGAMMSATTLLLLRLAPRGREGRALGHIGLANYGGLAAGPLLATAAGGARSAGSVFLLATILPALGGALGYAARTGPGRGGAAHGVGSRPGRLVAAVLGPGVGLALVNVGYVATLAFGGDSLAARGLDGSLVVPAFAVAVVLARTVAAGLPDHFGPRATLAASCAAEAVGLVALGHATSDAAAVASVALLAAGQALAVPALGLLVLDRVGGAERGAASGAFFSFFDLGVGLGGPASGAVARFAGASWALAAAAGAVALAPLVPLLTRRSGRPAGPAARRP